MSAYDRLLGTLPDRGTDDGKRAKVKCPAHEDNRASLSVTQIDGSVLVHCHAGCETADVLAAVGLTLTDLYDDRNGATYAYSDGRNVHRKPDKTFRQTGNTKGNALFHVEHIEHIEHIDGIETVYICEGEKDVLAIESVGGTAVCNAGGAGKAHLFDWSPLKGKHAIIIQDKDDAGRKHAAEVAAILEPIAESVKIVEAAEGCKDVADHIAADKGQYEFVDVPSPLLTDAITAEDLDGMVFGELEEHVPGLITEGFGVLAGPPKVGKSWLVAGIALACAQGGVALNGIRVQPRAVLLLALEDGNRRLQSRMRRLNANQPLPPNLTVMTKVVPGQLIPTISAWLKLHRHDERSPLVILDTLGKARPQRKAGDDPYIADYQMGTWIKNTIDAVPGAALIAVHHTRKTADEDWLNTVSGTQGITGSADWVLVLTRKRKSNDGLIAVTGRDVNENEYAVTVDQGIWRIDGSDLHSAADRAETRREEGRLGDRALEVLAVVNGRFETRAADVSKALGIEVDQARVYLGRLAGKDRIRKRGRGVYGPVSYVPTDTNGQGNETDITEQTQRIDQEDKGKPVCCKHCDQPLIYPESIARGYCARSGCLPKGGEK